MSWDNKVVWSEGLFLRPQHLQQLDRRLDRAVRAAVDRIVPYGWGVHALRINTDLLALGKFAVATCHGAFDDGTDFAIPEEVDHPPPLEVPEDARDVVVHLVLPVRQPGMKDFDRPDNPISAARYAVHEFEAVDTIAGRETRATLEIGRLRLRYALETENRAGFVGIGLARIVEVRSDRQIVLDDRYIPPCFSCQAAPPLRMMVNDLEGLLHHRGEALAARVAGTGARGVAEIADFLLLQTVNRYQPVLRHFASAESIHPETFYRLCVALAGELATFTADTKRPAAFPAYRHDDLKGTFGPVMEALRLALSAMLDETAIPIPLEDRKYGVRVASIANRRLLTEAAFVLATRADMPIEQLRRHLPNQAKLGPVEDIRNLVNVALPGIALQPLPVAPRQIPFHAGMVYFQLDQSSPYWKALATSGGLAIHVAGEFPGLHMELWAIRG